MARPVIRFRPWRPDAALAVYRHLDPADLGEVEALGLDWEPWTAVALRYAMLPQLLEAQVAEVERPKTGVTIPFAALALAPHGVAGVASAEFLAVNHRFYRRELGQLVIELRRALPEIAARHGLNRIEFRADARHPTVAALAACLGFRLEARCPGFGRDGRTVARLFAWTAPHVAAAALAA